LSHNVDTLGWRVTEPITRKFDKGRLDACGLYGPAIKILEREGSLSWQGKVLTLDDVSDVRKGAVFAFVLDSRPCPNILKIAQRATIMLCESTYLEEHQNLAIQYAHMTAAQAAQAAKDAQAERLILTHYSSRYQDLNCFYKEACPIFPNTWLAEYFVIFPFPKREPDPRITYRAEKI